MWLINLIVLIRLFLLLLIMLCFVGCLLISFSLVAGFEFVCCFWLFNALADYLIDVGFAGLYCI